MKRIFRGRPLTPEEAEEYDQVRKQVMEEFPPVSIVSVMNQAIRELWKEGDRSAAIAGVIFYPFNWVLLYFMRRHKEKE